MLTSTSGYDVKMIDGMGIDDIKADEITEILGQYLSQYKSCFLNHSQERYFYAFQRGLMSDLDRKTIEPIALAFLGEKDVRGLQQFFQRSTLPDAQLLERYQEILAASIASEDGFLSVDGSDFVKKGYIRPEWLASIAVDLARQKTVRLAYS